MSGERQSFANHAKMVPGYHYLNGALLVVLVFWTTRALLRGFSGDTLIDLLLVLSLMIVTWYARVFPLGVQDRVIRLEERLRMSELLPEALRGRIGEFTTEQLIGLRFASDAELPELARRVLDEGISDRKAIKAAVKEWRADDQRI